MTKRIGCHPADDDVDEDRFNDDDLIVDNAVPSPKTIPFH